MTFRYKLLSMGPQKVDIDLHRTASKIGKESSSAQHLFESARAVITQHFLLK